jgi:hypothetical protein
MIRKSQTGMKIHHANFIHPKQKKMKTSRIYVMLALAGVLASCAKESGTGNIETEVRNVANFNKIVIQSAANVDIYSGDSYLVEVSDYENLLDYIHLYVEKETLFVKTRPSNVILRNSKARVNIIMPEVLQKVEIAGSGDIWVADPMNTLHAVKISGSGNFESASSGYDELSLSIQGSGNIRMSGTANHVLSRISGSGNIKLGSLETRTADCTISGSGNISIYVSHQLNATITGSGNIHYYGNPSVNASITGSGRLKKL